MGGQSCEGQEGKKADSASQFVGQGRILATHIHASLWDLQNSAQRSASVRCRI